MTKVLDFRKTFLFFVVLLGLTGFFSLQSVNAESLTPTLDPNTAPTTDSTLPAINGATPYVIVDPGEGSGYSMEPGDIFTTSATSSSGLTGHSGIAITSTYILHIPAPGTTTERLTLAQWKSKYRGGTTWVHRVHSLTYSQRTALAKYIASKYWNAWGSIDADQSIRPSYAITTNTSSFNPTYCSKIVWQAYYYGTGSLPVIGWGNNTIITPYSIRDGSPFNANYKPSLYVLWNL